MSSKRPDRKFSIKIDGETREVIMSFAMFQEIMKVVPTAEKVAELLIQDFYLREYVARRLLTGQKKITNDDDLFNLFEHEFDDDQLDEMLLWVVDHILYFFTNTAEKSVALGQKHADKIKALTPSDQSQTGSPD